MCWVNEEVKEKLVYVWDGIAYGYEACALIEEGKTLAEIKKIFKVEDRPARPGGRRWLSLVEVIYLELTENK